MTTYDVLIAIPLITGLFYTLVYGSGTDDVRVEATAPVNPAEEDGILSIRCQVWNLGQDQEVAMVRIPASGGKTERLTLAENVLAEDDRMFLAVRTLEDSSSVYFLSIMRVRKEDAGEYRCAIYKDEDGAFVEKTRDSINAMITYFPAESHPQCDSYPSSNTLIMAGTEITLNCSSEMALPTVTLTWSKGSPDSSVPSEQINENGKTYSVLKVIPKNADTNLVYLCTITSTAFPERQSTCHIGPLTILHNPSLPPDEGDDDDQDANNKPTSNLNDPHIAGDDKEGTNRGANNEVLDSGIASSCAQECSYTDSAAFYWVVATIIAAILAIFFLIIGIVILLRYCKLQEERKVEYTIARQRNDQQIYAELDSRRGEKVYMYLDHKNPKTLTEPLNYTSTPGKDIHEHYGIIPHVPRV